MYMQSTADLNYSLLVVVCMYTYVHIRTTNNLTYLLSVELPSLILQSMHLYSTIVDLSPTPRPFPVTCNTGWVLVRA